jgi:hypothetical protein
VGRTLALTAILVVITGAVASSEVAARQPTPAQTRGLLAALPKFIRSVLRKCIRFDMSVSANRRYARVSPVFLKRDASALCEVFVERFLDPEEDHPMEDHLQRLE